MQTVQGNKHISTVYASLSHRGYVTLDSRFGEYSPIRHFNESANAVAIGKPFKDLDRAVEYLHDMEKAGGIR